MSDNSSGSSGSSSNSWTLLSPEEAAIDTAGPPDDGTESIGDVPSLSEEVAGSSIEVKPRESEAPQETVLSEEGHQVCQETSPELFTEGAVSGPSVEADPEICAPVIHATITTSPPDNDLLGAVPFGIATESSLFLSQEPFLETSYEDDIQPTFDFTPEQCLVPEVVADTTPEFVGKIGPASGPVPEIVPASGPVPEIVPASGPVPEIVSASGPVPEIVPVSGPVPEIVSASGPVPEIVPVSRPVPEIVSASGPVPEIVFASGPVPEIVSASGLVPEIVSASGLVPEIVSASGLVPEIVSASGLVPEIGPASGPVPEIGPASRPVPVSKMVPASEPVPELSPSSEAPESSFSDVTADVSSVSDDTRTSAIPVSEIDAGVSLYPKSSSPSLSSEINFSSAAGRAFPETAASLVLEEKELVTDREEHKSIYLTREAETLGTDVPIEHRGEDSGPRRRRVHYSEELRQSSDEEDKEEMEFKLPDRKEEKPGLSMSHVIIGALALLCLGSFFFSDDFDGSEISDQELLEKLVEENKQISILEAQMQAQKEELDQAVRAAAEKGITDQEHAKMKEELSALPSLKEELEALKARVSELTQLTGEEPSVPPPGFVGEGESPAGPETRRGKKDELKRQKALLEQSKTRLEGMKKQDWPKKWIRERLVEMQQRLSEQVDRIGKKDEWRRKRKGGENRKTERGDGVQKQKELLKKYRDDWEHKKAERKLERERRQQERSWQVRPAHKHKHDPKVRKHCESKDFWKHQEKKLRRNQNPPEHCHDVSGCAEAEGLVRVKLSDFQGLLDIYLNKLRGLSAENKEAFRRLMAQFFHGGIFSHDRMLFSEFAEDVADILEDLADVLTDDEALEEEMEEFERQALWRFAA